MKEIVRLYEEGHSIKEISKLKRLTVIKVRRILREAGFDTRAYRRVSDQNRRLVILLIAEGYSYRVIGELLHLSPHFIREVVVENELIGFAPRNHAPVRFPNPIPPISEPREAEFWKLYASGQFGLGRCTEAMCLTDEEFLWFVYHLTPEAQAAHHSSLRKHIRSLYRKGNSVGNIVKATEVANSFVRETIQDML